MYLTTLRLGAFLDMYRAEIFTTGREYVSFIILLGALFVISGGIVIKGSLSASRCPTC